MKNFNLKSVSISKQAPDMTLLVKELKAGFAPLKMKGKTGNMDSYALGFFKIKS